MKSIKEEILESLKPRAERLEEHLAEEVILSEDELFERAAIESMNNRAFDYNTLAKQYVKATMHTLLSGKSNAEIADAYDKAIRSVVMGIKSTFVGNKKVTNENLFAAAQKDSRVAKLLRLNMTQTINSLKRIGKAGTSNEEAVKAAMRGGASLVDRYAMFEESVKKICADQNWVKEFKKSICGDATKGFNLEGKKAPTPDKDLKKAYDERKKILKSKNIEYDEGGYGNKYSVDAEEDCKKKASCDTKKKASCDTKKKASKDTEKKCSENTEENKKKAWNEVKERKIFNY